MLKSMPIRVIEDELLLKYNPHNRTIEELRKMYMPIPFKEGLFLSSLNLKHKAHESIKCISDILFFIKDNQITENKRFRELDMDKYMKLSQTADDVLDSYGVCDNFEQVLALYPLNEIDGNFSISFTPMYKKDQPKVGGWKWHKWGNYIGTQESQYEYLYDEKNIDLVYVYHIYKWLEK